MKLKEVKHVGQGLEQGATSILKGFEKGFTGTQHISIFL